MASKWLDTLKEQVSLHVNQNTDPIGPAAKQEMPINPPSKTSNTTTEAEHLGLVATWSIEFGYLGLHDPTYGE
jgi:hypothetical protein